MARFPFALCLVRRDSLARWWRIGMALAMTGLPALARAEDSAYTVQDLDRARSMLGDMQRIVTKYYFPPAGVGKAFEAKCAETNRALEKAHSNGEAFGLIADALASVDPQIRFFPPLRRSRVDYSWKWQLVGDVAYVVEVDHVGDARKQGRAPCWSWSMRTRAVTRRSWRT